MRVYQAMRVYVYVRVGVHLGLRLCLCIHAYLHTKTYRACIMHVDDLLVHGLQDT
jgi:hypothetical protein